jgi:hypothetical protein
MSPSRHPARRPLLAATAAGAAAGLAYGGYALSTWLGYGRPHRRGSGPFDAVLDEFMPEYEIAECHETEVRAPAGLTYAAARAMDLNRSPLVRVIFELRALPTRARGEHVAREPRSLVAETRALGWRELIEVPDRLLVMGAVTRAWEGAPVFRGLAPEAFREFAEPGYVKILWTLEADPIGPARSRFRTETRAVTTDPTARARFRSYWALVSPGVRTIRRESLRLVRREAERRLRPARDD